MNTRSTSRQNRLEGHNRRVGSDATPRLVYRAHKRWQSKQRHPQSLNFRRATAEANLPTEDTLMRQQALAAAQQGKHQEAIDRFTQLIGRYPNSAMDYNNRGLVYFQSGQRSAAIADYNKALQLNPRLDSVYNNRANYYAAQGQLLEAILDYEMALDLNPNNIRAWINQGITLRDLQMYERAIECFELALAFGRLEGHIYAERGRTYHLWGDWNCAMADYQRAIIHLPSPTGAKSDPSVRLRLQVELWLDDLLSPIQ
jgi:tetratricopeptide (TPR) repeat protein